MEMMRVQFVYYDKKCKAAQNLLKLFNDIA
jgi:hypothetical protein